jgi:hypothetical protein
MGLKDSDGHDSIPYIQNLIQFINPLYTIILFNLRVKPVISYYSHLLDTA